MSGRRSAALCGEAVKQFQGHRAWWEGKQKKGSFRPAIWDGVSLMGQGGRELARNTAEHPAYHSVLGGWRAPCHAHVFSEALRESGRTLSMDPASQHSMARGWPALPAYRNTGACSSSLPSQEQVRWVWFFPSRKGKQEELWQPLMVRGR